MGRSIRLLGAAGLLAMVACGAAHHAAPPAFQYPQLLQQAGVEGPVRFRVRLDSVGSPQVTTLEILVSPNPGFAPAVRTALEGWHDPSMAGRIADYTVRFVIMDTAATDSVRRCGSGGGGWGVCARRVRPHRAYVN